MRIEGFSRGLGSILLASAIVLSIAIPVTSAWIPENPPKPPTVIEEPGGTTIIVCPGGTFTIQFKLRWIDPFFLGYFSLGIYWDSPKKDSSGTENENFTFVSASAYLEDNLDNIPVGWNLTEGVPPENENVWRHMIIVDHTEGYPWDDNFYVDIVLRASGAGGVPHVLTNNHPIIISGTIDVVDSAFYPYLPPDPYITIKVTNYTGTAVFSLENVWAVRLEKNLDLENGSKLMVKFYTWYDAFQDESVIENFVPPWHVEENEIVPHPQGKPVENARLVLTDNAGSVISTIASFTVRRSTLIDRVRAIKSMWPYEPIKKPLIDEISVIKGQWSLAPS